MPNTTILTEKRRAVKILSFIILVAFSLSSIGIAFRVHSKKKESKEQANLVETLAANKQYDTLGRYLRESCGSKFTVKDLQKSKDPLIAKLASEIKALPLEKNMEIGKIFETVLFCKTSHPFSQEVEKHYLPKEQTGMPYAIDYDPVAGLSFIDLELFLGKGKSKVVTKAIMVSSDRLELVAKATQKSDIDRELATSRLLSGVPGIFTIYGCTQHRENEKIYSSVYSKIYRSGALRGLFDSGYHFSLNEKMSMSLQILHGLEALHSRNLVHRDLGSRNYFVDIPEGPIGKRAIACAIADLGRANYIDQIHDKKIQGNTSYTAPEGVFHKKLEKSAYFGCDVYAVGCVLYQLFYDRNPEWRSSHYVKSRKNAIALYNELVENIRQATDKRREELQKLATLGPKEEFEYLILRMVDPNPTSRPDAKTARQEMERIIARM
jgi:serine/threonine protein kinase